MPTTQEGPFPVVESVSAVNPSAVLRLGAPSLVAVLVAALVPVLGMPASASAATVTGSPVSAVPMPTAEAAVAVGSAQIAAQVKALDREVARVRVALTAGVTRYEQAQDRLAGLTQDRLAARDRVEARQAAAAATRASRDGLARAAYKGGVPPLVAALLSGDPRTVADLA